MATIELRLNRSKTGNYAFFCPVTKLHLTLANPVGITDRVSNYILRGIRSNTIIDVNKVIDLKTGELNVKNVKSDTQVKSEPTVAQKQVVQEVIQEQKEELSQEVEVAVEEEKKQPKRGKKIQTNSVNETESEVVTE